MRTQLDTDGCKTLARKVIERAVIDYDGIFITERECAKEFFLGDAIDFYCYFLNVHPDTIRAGVFNKDLQVKRRKRKANLKRKPRGKGAGL